MTLATTTARMDYVGTGSTGPFSYTYRILDEDDLEVTVRDVAGVETSLVFPTDFSVTGTRNRAGGTITLTNALAVGETLTIRRVLAIRQTTDLRNLGAFLPDTIEDQFDRGIMIDQQLFDGIERSMRFPVSVDPDAVSAELPVPDANLILGWNAAGTALENKPLASSDNVVLPAEGRTVTTLTSYLANNAVYNVVDYGAFRNSVTDSQVKFQNAANAMPTTGGTYFVPDGRYRVYDTVDLHGSWGGGVTDGSSSRFVLGQGAIVEFWCATINKPLFRFNDLIGQDTNLILEGGQLDGVHAAAGCDGIAIHSSNVSVRDAAIRNFPGAAIRMVNDLAVPPICCEIKNIRIKLCGYGIYSTADAAQLNVFGGRIEDCLNHGIYFKGGGKVNLWGPTVENNGILAVANIGVWPAGTYPPQILIEDAGEANLQGGYCESFANQPHDEIVIQGVILAAGAIRVSGWRFVNYGQTCLNIGPNGGAVRSVVIDGGNLFVMTSGVAIRIGSGVRGFRIGQNDYSDSTFADGGLATRYVVHASAIGTIEDTNQFVSGHTITHQGIDLTAETLTSLGVLKAGKITSDQVTSGYYRPLRIQGRVTGGSYVRGDIESIIGNGAELNVVAGTRPAAPVAALAAAGAGNVDNGAHTYKVTFVDAAGESTGGTVSGTVTVVDKTTNGKVALSSIALGNTPVTARKIYRTKVADASAYFLLTTLADNTTTVYTDNTADSGLGAAMPTTSTTADRGLVINKVARGIGTIGNVDDQDLAIIINNVEQARHASTGLYNVRLGLKVAGTQVIGTQKAAVADVASANATDLATAITLVNELKTQVNALLNRTRAGTGHGLFS